MPRPANNPVRRAQITGALKRVMAERGYEGASITRIAEAADLAPGLLHYHFGSKAEILLALLDELWEEQVARAETSAAAPDDPRERLGAWLDALLALENRDQDALRCWAILGAEALKRQDVGAAYLGFLHSAAATLRRLVSQALAAEHRSQKDVPAIATGVLAAVEGFVRVGCAAPGLIPAGSAAQVARRMAFGLLDAQPRLP
jgi:TetR/AcrR family transcriptional repressor of bet genes